MNILKNYKYEIKNISKITKGNQLFVRLIKYCFVFLYAFIYKCDENKVKI